MASRAVLWVDDDDVEIESRKPAFLKQSSAAPSWAPSLGASTSSSVGDDAPTAASKRPRNEELEDALASTAPLLASKHQRTTTVKPSIVSTFMMPRDMCHALEWHPNAQLCTAAGNHHIYMFHASGKYVETLAKIDVGCARIETMRLTASAEDAVVVPHESFQPILVNLATETKTPLTFLDTRENFAYRHDYRSDTHGKQNNFIRRLCVRSKDRANQLVGVAHNNTIILGSLSSGSVAQKIHLSDPLLDMAFTGQQELTVATRDRIVVYDIRRSARAVRQFVDEGSIGATAFAFGADAFAVASKGGMVNVYQNGATAPTKTLKNLTTDVSMLSFGTDRHGDSVFVMASPDQKNGARLVKLPACTVVPSFPEVGARHNFLHAASMAPTAPILSLGERGKITNYVV